MLFALYAILFLAGIYMFGLAFAVPEFGALIFIAGILLVSAALATPFTASALERRRG